MATKKKPAKKPAKVELKNLQPKNTPKVKSVAPRTVACDTPSVPSGGPASVTKRKP